MTKKNVTSLPSFAIEDSSDGIVIGVDEVGRGPLAGPVVAAAVLLDRENYPEGINDSKKLSKIKRQKIFDDLHKTAKIGVGIVSSEEIDKINILQASLLAMKIAVENLDFTPDMVLVDGNKLPDLPYQMLPIIKGDGKSLSIAAASIIAKVTRDEIMTDLALEFPHFMWQNNSGYGTKQHLQAIEKHGITDHHRKSFKPIRK